MKRVYFVGSTHTAPKLVVTLRTISQVSKLRASLLQTWNLEENLGAVLVVFKIIALLIFGEKYLFFVNLQSFTSQIL